MTRWRIGALSFIAVSVSACGGGGGGGSGGNNPPPPAPATPNVSFSTATASAAENGTATVTVTMSAAAGTAVTVPFTVTGTATGAGTDYTVSASPVTIAAGATSASIVVTAVNDTADEADETVIITLGTPTGATLGANTSATVTIADDDAAVAGATISGRVTDAATGSALAGVSVRGGGASATSAADGTYTLSGVADAQAAVVSFELEGFVPQSRTAENLSAVASQVINVPMLEVALTTSFDANAAASLAVPNSTARIELPANAFKTESGAAPSGQVTAMVTPVSAAGNVDVMPGDYLGEYQGVVSSMETFGALDARFVDATGASLDLNDGATSTIRIPVSSRSDDIPATMPLFHFDTEAGIWRQEGTATLQGTEPNRYYEGTVTHFTTWNADVLYSSVNVTGCVVDGNGEPVAGANVTSEGKDYTGRASVFTDADGNFTVKAKPNSAAFLQARKGEAVSNSAEIVTLTTDMERSECLVLTQSTVSIKLTWGGEPNDLDSHTLAANSDEHIYYVNKGSLTQMPFVALDVDDTDGFGPEVTTFSRLARSRTYRFYVDNYSETYDPGQTGSPARIELTNGGNQTVFTPPTGESEATAIWHVFDLTTDDSCNITVTPVQQFASQEPSNPNVGNDATYCD